MKSNNDNRRVRYTKMFLQESLLELLKEKPIKSVTVTELCEAADINRGTFYNYYTDVYDLLEQIEDSFFDALKTAVTGEGQPELYMNPAKNAENRVLMLSYLDSILAVIQQHRDLCSVLFSDNGDKQFLQKAIYVAEDFCIKQWFSLAERISQNNLRMLYIFLANGSVGVVREWIITGMKEPAEHIAEVITMLCAGGISVYLNMNHKAE